MWAGCASVGGERGGGGGAVGGGCGDSVGVWGVFRCDVGLWIVAVGCLCGVGVVVGGFVWRVGGGGRVGGGVGETFASLF